MENLSLAVIGATGLVGRTVLKVLEEKNLPIKNYFFFASEKSDGKKITFLNKEYIVRKLELSSFEKHFSYAIFCAGGNISKQFIPFAISQGSVVIDNSSVFRMDKNVPLVVPEINANEIKKQHKLISNPNCSTIQAVIPLKPLDVAFNIKRIVYSTYQAVSGAGVKGVNDLKNGINNYVYKEPYTLQKFPCAIFNNCIPHIDSFLENGYTKEEEKMINETRKILKKPELKITATTVRVPVFNSHSESINIEFEKDFDLNNLCNILRNSSGIVLSNENYPTTLNSNNSDKVYVGRVRRDFSVKSGINLWTVSDNLRKGAATNAVQILEYLLKKLN